MDTELREVLSKAEETLIAQLNEARAYGHPAGTGDKRENALRGYLRRFLPECFGLRRGRIIDSFGGVSAEFDIICYLKGVCPYWLDERMEGRLFVPVESVIATFEVKSYLNKKELQKAVHSFGTIEPLRRRFQETAMRTVVRQMTGKKDHSAFSEPVPAFETREGIPSIYGSIVYLDGLKVQTAGMHMGTNMPTLLLAWGIRRHELLVRLPTPQYRFGAAATIHFAGIMTGMLAKEAERAVHVLPLLDGYWDLVARQEQAFAQSQSPVKNKRLAGKSKARAVRKKK
jgi:hypothetical protein